MGIFIFFTVSLIFVCATCRSPVILVPGTGGSQLEAKLIGKPSSPRWYCKTRTSYYFSLWLNPKSLFPLSLTCWQDNMRLRWNIANMTVTNTPGVLTRAPGFGGTSSVETIDGAGLVPYMKPLVNFLTTSLGYTKGKDVRGAPYDFRYTPDIIPNNFYRNFKTLIETTFASNGNTPVTIISHSYGGHLTLYFLSMQSQSWKNTHIKQWISMSGAFGGAKSMIEPFAAGNLLGVPKFLVDPLSFRYVQRTVLSNLFLLPIEGIWPETDVIVKTPKRSYTIPQIDEFLDDIGLSHVVKMRHHILNTTALMHINPGVKVHCIYGLQKDSTVETLVYKDNNNFPDKVSQHINGYGDGAVNYKSLVLCNKFAEMNVGTISQMSDVDHSGVLSDSRTYDTLKKLL